MVFVFLTETIGTMTCIANYGSAGKTVAKHWLIFSCNIVENNIFMASVAHLYCVTLSVFHIESLSVFPYGKHIKINPIAVAKPLPLTARHGNVLINWCYKRVCDLLGFITNCFLTESSASFDRFHSRPTFASRSSFKELSVLDKTNNKFKDN